MMRFKVSRDPQTSTLFVKNFMESPEAKPFLTNPDGQPGFCVCDSKKPLQGLQVLGFEAAEVFDEELSLEDGDVLVFQARPN
ncbi:hypothetical protein, partial [Salmonella enterica]|uniref:hypothetical protein n=1 Tax=Salmonella enterica TaxID=28901 RepID=UPI003CF8202B